MVMPTPATWLCSNSHFGRKLKLDNNGDGHLSMYLKSMNSDEIEVCFSLALKKKSDRPNTIQCPFILNIFVRQCLSDGFCAKFQPNRSLGYKEEEVIHKMTNPVEVLSSRGRIYRRIGLQNSVSGERKPISVLHGQICSFVVNSLQVKSSRSDLGSSVGSQERRRLNLPRLRSK